MARGCWGNLAPVTFPQPPAVGHHHPGHRTFLPRLPEEGLPLRRDGDSGQELGWHSRPQVVLQVRSRQEPGAPGRTSSCRVHLSFKPSATQPRFWVILGKSLSLSPSSCELGTMIAPPPWASRTFKLASIHVGMLGCLEALWPLTEAGRDGAGLSQSITLCLPPMGEVRYCG